MSYLKVERKNSGSYLRIMESFRDEHGKPSSRILHTLGKLEDFTPQQLRSMGIKLFELGGGQIKTLLQGELIEIGRYNYGYQQIFGKALHHFGLTDLFRRLTKKHKLSFNLGDAIFLMLLDRLQDPASKRSSFLHQNEYLNLPKIELHHLYRALDKLAAANLLVQQHIFHTGRDLFNRKLDVVFYDVTTFYFQSDVEKEDELRQMGFGKDGKIGKTQILFCMMIDRDKNPIGYRIFNGKTFEGDTFEHAVKDLKNQYDIDKVIVVADRGMLSKHNLDITTNNGFEFIIGERLKRLKRDIQKPLLDIKNYGNEWIYEDNEGKSVVIKYTVQKLEGKTIIGTYSSKRAAKDKHDREEALEKAQKILKNPDSLKKKASRYYLKADKTQTYSLDTAKIERSERYDGFLAISTNNNNLPVAEILDQYKQLYKIQNSFRTFKSHLETRPMFHWTDTRIEGHICLCYIAFALQNYVLQMANKTEKLLTETSLRATIDKMQVSLLAHNTENVYVRSAQTPQEITLQKNLGLKAINPLTPEDSLKI
jgi:transposase